MDGFLGEYPHSLDAKGRLILPAKFRAPFESGAVIGMGQNGCLAVYPPTEWQRVAAQTEELAREGGERLTVARAIWALASPVTPDKQGRVAIPQSLREYAGLDREVVVSGALTRLEIWDAKRWRDQRSRAAELLNTDMTLPGLVGA